MPTRFCCVVAFAVLSAALALPVVPAPARAASSNPRGMELLGYLENWVDVKWWDNNMPGNCYQGCFEPAAFIKTTAPYSALNYGFSFLTQNPDPDQLDCTGQHGGAKDAGCPVWDGNAIYLSKASKPFAIAVDSSTTVEKVSPSIVAIGEAVRLGRMHPAGPKRVKITLGGWSDYARLSTPELATKAGVLAAKLVQYSFADGIDLDFEHLTPFANMTGDQEYAAFAALITSLRTEFTKVEANWAATAKARHDALQAEFMAMQPWQRNNAKDFFSTNLQYLKELQANPVPHLEISWCTRFNAFVPKDDPFNYAMPGTNIPNVTYPTDNEGTHFWPQVGDLVDTVNIMAYDAGGLTFNFTTILENFVNLGNVSKTKINMGFEPGAQYAGGVWEGETVDKAAAQWIKENGFGGVMVWAVDVSSKQNPKGAEDCPLVATEMEKILAPTYAWGPAPKYTKCSASTGWAPNAPMPGPSPPTPPSPTPPSPTPPSPTPPTPPSPTPPGPPGTCAAAWQQCGAAGHPSCCDGACACTGSSAYKQCSPPKGKFQCGTTPTPPTPPPAPTPPAPPTPPSPPAPPTPPSPPGKDGLPEKVVGLYLLVADDTWPYTSTTVWTPKLPAYMNSVNVLWLAFVNPALMPALPPGMISIAKNKPAGVKVVAAIGGEAYSTHPNPWDWLTSTDKAEAMAAEVFKWKAQYGIDGVDLDIETGAGDAPGAGAACVAFAKKLKELDSDFIVTQPVFGSPQVKEENDAVNTVFGPGGDVKTIDSVGIMVYEGTGSLQYVKDYTKGKEQWQGFPIKVDVPSSKIVLGAGGQSGAGTIEALAKAAHDQNLRGIMVWYASVIDSATGKPGNQYGGGSMDASTQSAASQAEWAKALSIMQGK